MAANWSRDRFNAVLPRCGFERGQEICASSRGRVGIKHHCDAAKARGDIDQQIEPLASDRTLKVDEARDISSRSGQACNEPRNRSV
jgi:hypothetical protein